MKNVYLARIFIEGARDGQGSHMFIEGNVIYSYGKHFPLCIRIYSGYRKVFIINTDGYSRTTSKHKGYVARAIGSEVCLKKNTAQMNEIIEKGMVDLKEVLAECL